MGVLFIYKGFAKTSFGALGRSWFLNLERVHHNALKTVHRTVFARRTDMGTGFRILQFWRCDINKRTNPIGLVLFLVGEGGFEPPKSLTTDLQSAPFGHSGIPPYAIVLKNGGAGRRTRTPDLLITNQLLYQLSYTSISAQE